MTTRVVVIGGGFAGVAAAVRLRAHGVTVTLLDDHRALGGRARSDVLAGTMIDTGAQLVSTAFARTVRLLSTGAVGDAERETGDAAPRAASRSGSPLQRTAGRDAYVQDGVRYPLQFGSIRSLLTFGGLGAVDKLRLATQFLPLLTRHRASLDADASRVPEVLDAESARSFMRTRVGEHATDVLVEPPLNGFYAVRGAEASLAFYLMLGRYASDSDVLAPAAGWSRALDAVLDQVTVEREVTAEAIDVDAAGVTVRDATRGAWRADAVVIATGPRAARALLAPLVEPASELTAWLGQVTTRATWTVALALDARPARDAFGIFQDATAARSVSACAVHGAKLPGLAPERDVVLAWPTPDAVHRLRDASSAHIVAAMLPEIEALVPAVRGARGASGGAVAQARVYRFDDGTPVAQPGFAADRARGRQLAAALTRVRQLPIALAGDYLTAPLIEGAVASGELAAEQLAGRLRLSTPGAPLDS